MNGHRADFYLARKDLADGRTLFVVPLTYGRARLIVGFGYGTYYDAW